MNIQELNQRIKESKSIKDKADRLLELRNIAEDLTNNLTECMSVLECEIEFVLDRTPQKTLNELNYYSVQDVTTDISVTKSYEY
jgi:hypothetical protein